MPAGQDRTHELLSFDQVHWAVVITIVAMHSITDEVQGHQERPSVLATTPENRLVQLFDASQESGSQTFK